MVGYWPSSFFACFVLIRKKQEQGRYPTILTRWIKFPRKEQSLEESSLAGHGGYSRAGKVASSCSGSQP